MYRIAVLALLVIPNRAVGQGEVQPLFALHILGPQKLAVDAGVHLKPSQQGRWWATATGALGWAGGEVALGVTRKIGPEVDFGGPGGESTFRLQVGLLRTWSTPRYLNPSRTYGGLEVTVTIPLLGIRVGAFHPADGRLPDGWATTAGVIIGWH